jgi:hypothetical protein
MYYHTCNNFIVLYSYLIVYAYVIPHVIPFGKVLFMHRRFKYIVDAWW